MDTKVDYIQFPAESSLAGLRNSLPQLLKAN